MSEAHHGASDKKVILHLLSVLGFRREHVAVFTDFFGWVEDDESSYVLAEFLTLGRDENVNDAVFADWSLHSPSTYLRSHGFMGQRAMFLHSQLDRRGGSLSNTQWLTVTKEQFHSFYWEHYSTLAARNRVTLSPAAQQRHTQPLFFAEQE